MHSPQINAIVAIEKGISCEKLLKDLCYEYVSEEDINSQFKKEWETDLSILKKVFKTRTLQRKTKKATL